MLAEAVFISHRGDHWGLILYGSLLSPLHPCVMQSLRFARGGIFIANGGICYSLTSPHGDEYRCHFQCGKDWWYHFKDRFKGLDEFGDAVPE